MVKFTEIAESELIATVRNGTSQRLLKLLYIYIDSPKDLFEVLAGDAPGGRVATKNCLFNQELGPLSIENAITIG